MSLPETIRVKLSSEAAESISLTPVVVREMALRELIEYMIGVTGKDVRRVRELLRGGTLVSGASRFRWTGWEPDLESVHALLATFPDPDPGRAFTAAGCMRVVLRGGRQSVEITREAGRRKPLLRRSSFWDLLMQMAAGAPLRYGGYSYKDRADWFQMDLPVASAERLRAAHGLVRYTTLRDQIRTLAFASADLYVLR